MYMTITEIITKHKANINVESNFFIEYMDSLIEIKTNQNDLIRFIDKKISPFFDVFNMNTYEKKCDLSLFIARNASIELKPLLDNGFEITIDTSMYEEQKSNGIRVDYDDGYIIYVNKTESFFVFCTQTNEVYLFNDNLDLLVRDAIRFIKSITSILCEKKQSLMLHASGAILDKNNAILFLADARNGKTTILLEMLTKFKTNILSCDTIFLRSEKDDLIARGWPSNFSISKGTLHDYSELNELIPDGCVNLTYNQAWDIHKKYVLDTNDVKKLLNVEITPECAVRTFVFLNFSPDSITQMCRIKSYDSIHDWVKRVYLGSRDALYPNWHQFKYVDDKKIDRTIQEFVDYILKNDCEVYQMNWAPSPEQLLRQIDLLDNYNKKTLSRRKNRSHII